MKIRIFFSTVLLVFTVNNIFAGINTSKYGGAFLESGVDARILAMGGAGTTAASSASSVYWNPSGLLFLNGSSVHGMHSERFSGIVNWDFLGFGGKVDSVTAIGIGLFRMGIDGIPFTRLRNSSLGLGEYYTDESGKLIQNVPEIDKMVNDAEYAFFFSIARRRSKKLIYGTTVKVIRKKCNEYGAWGLGFDAGILFRYSEHINLGLNIRDITTTLTAWNNGTKEKILPSLRAGISIPFNKSKISFLPVLDFAVGFDGREAVATLAAGSMYLYLRSGIEIGYKQKIFFRAGSDRGRITLGAGFLFKSMRLDYGFASHSDLGSTHRISVEYNLKRVI
ncbi:PorV/PorQ family protein [bacterium]|nr:PorV/PorQ family protein [bacterium]